MKYVFSADRLVDVAAEHLLPEDISTAAGPAGGTGSLGLTSLQLPDYVGLPDKGPAHGDQVRQALIHDGLHAAQAPDAVDEGNHHTVNERDVQGVRVGWRSSLEGVQETATSSSSKSKPKWYVVLRYTIRIRGLAGKMAGLLAGQAVCDAVSELLVEYDGLVVAECRIAIDPGLVHRKADCDLCQDRVYYLQNEQNGGQYAKEISRQTVRRRARKTARTHQQRDNQGPQVQTSTRVAAGR